MTGRTLLAAVALLGLACTGQRERPKLDASPPPPAPDASPDVQKKRAKLKLPPPQEPPARPEGEPQAPKDFDELSDAAQAGRPVEKPGAPPIQRLDAYRLRVGRVLVDRKARKLEIPARVNMTEGILEYYAVASEGKLHESVLEVHAEPSHVHLGLVLLGLEPTKWGEPEPREPPKMERPGDTMRLFVEVNDPKTGEMRREPASKWLYSRKSKGSPPPQRWMFQGSTFWNGRYSADMDRSVIALIPDGIAVVWVMGDEGNPYQGADLGFEVNSKTIPPKDTQVMLVIEAATPAADEKKDPAAAPAPDAGR